MTHTEIKDIVKFWEALNLQKLYEDTVPISLCLQAQVKLNESKTFNPQFMRLSIPLVIRALAESKAYERNTFINFFESDIKDAAVAILKVKLRSLVENPLVSHNIDEEAAYTAELATKIAKEIDSVFSDVKNENITFHGIGILKDGTVTLSYQL